jgi:hypothetical protein
MKHSFLTFAFVLALSFFASLQVLCGQIAAAHQLSSPRVGVVRYPDGGVYLLYGLPGNYVLGPRVLDGADAASFSERGGLVARKGSLSLLDPDLSLIGTFETGEGMPLVDINGDPATAIAWLPAAQKLVHWNGQAFVSVSVPGLSQEGEVSFVSKRNPQTASLLLHSPSGSVSEASVSLQTGQILSVTTIVGAQGPSFRYRSFIIFSGDRDLLIATPSDGNTRRFPLGTADLKIERAASDCLHISSPTAQRNWLLHFRNNDMDLAELPSLPVEVTK